MVREILKEKVVFVFKKKKHIRGKRVNVMASRRRVFQTEVFRFAQAKAWTWEYILGHISESKL